MNAMVLYVLFEGKRADEPSAANFSHLVVSDRWVIGVDVLNEIVSADQNQVEHRPIIIVYLSSGRICCFAMLLWSLWRHTFCVSQWIYSSRLELARY